MPKKAQQSKPAPVTALLDAAKSEPVKNFTQMLRSLEKEFETYPEFLMEDAERMFRSCRMLFEKSKNKVVRYNALRLLKYVVTTKDFIRVHAEEVWSLIKKAIFDPDGNVRNASVSLLSRYRFGLSCITDQYSFRKRRISKKKQEEIDKFQKMMVEQFLELYDMEQGYAEDHADEDELWKVSMGRIVPSWETRDKILKTIRRALEESTRYLRLEKIAGKYGYKLPNYFMLDSYEPEEPEKYVPYQERGDKEAAVSSPDGTNPMILSSPPNPKDFRTFEEYEGALELRDYFINKVMQVEAVMSSCKSEEEKDAAMAALGFQKHLDAPCMKKWCEENYGCVSRNLMWHMRFFEECVFEGQLKPENMLLSDQEIQSCEEELCAALPEEWINVGSRKQSVFAWFIDLMNWFEWNQDKTSLEELASEHVFAAFMQEVYWWVMHVLRDRQLPDGWKGRPFIEEFLKSTHLIKKDDAKELLERFLGQQ